MIERKRFYGEAGEGNGKEMTLYIQTPCLVCGQETGH